MSKSPSDLRRDAVRLRAHAEKIKEKKNRDRIAQLEKERDELKEELDASKHNHGLTSKKLTEYHARSSDLEKERDELKAAQSGCLKITEHDSRLGGFIRAFWRRIQPFAHKYEKELPDELPIEFTAYMLVALSLFENPPAPPKEIE